MDQARAHRSATRSTSAARGRLMNHTTRSSVTAAVSASSVLPTASPRARGILARYAAGDGCRIEGCDDGDLVVGVQTLAGTAVGALVGALIGAALPAGQRWVDAGVSKPLRVAGLALHPAVRVSLRGRIDH